MTARDAGKEEAMRRQGVILLTLWAIWVAGPAVADVLQDARWGGVDLTRGQAEDLVRPEGKTRWSLEALEIRERWIRTVAADPAVAHELHRTDRIVNSGGTGIATSTYVDPTGGDAALRWLLPHRDSRLLSPTPGSAIVFDRRHATTTEHFWVRARRVGIGWVHLPAGPREVVLQQALVLRRDAGERAWRPHELVYRWIDPRAGVVAQSWGPASPDGMSMRELEGAAVVEEILAGDDPLVIYADQLDAPILGRVTYGFDRGSDTPVSTLAPESPADMGTLVGLGSWDLSGNNLSNFPGMLELASTTTTVSSDETCNFDQCGFTIPGLKLGREDKNFDVPEDVNITINGTEREDRATDVTFWLRAAVRHEGQAGIGVDAESRICYVTDGGETRTEVPLFRFAHEDATGWFFGEGDSWSSDADVDTAEVEPFDCEMNIFFQGLSPCNCSLFCEQRLGTCQDASCGAGTETFSGTQSNTVLATGPLTLPSGHTFNSAVIRQVAEFCVFDGGSSCPIDNPVQPVRTVLWLWEVPYLGTVVRLQSIPLACQVDGLTTLGETDIKFGLFPPKTITVENVTDTTVELSWDPGADTHRIGVPGGDDYRVYWDTDSGADSAYGFNSIDDAGQVTITGTSAVISGLTAGVQYFFSVTSRSEYANPSTQSPIVYESVLYPTQVGGAGSFVPAEVSALTGAGCLPTTEIDGVTVDKTGGGVEICWEPTIDTCVDGYRIFGATSPQSDSEFSVLVPDTGLVTCHQFDPSDTFFIVAGKGAGGAGPLGHFGL